jgi:hypothetical protein
VPTPEAPRASRRTLWLLIAACVIPVLASYGLYYVWRPTAFKNYGDLIPVTPLLEAGGPGAASPLAALKGKWVLVSIDGGACDAKCEDKLIALRQLRLAQGKEMDRLERAWLVDDATAPTRRLLDAIDGTQVVAPAAAELVRQFPADASARDHLYVIDPLGNLMMRFPKNADPNRVKKDLAHLLRVSRIG